MFTHLYLSQPVWGGGRGERGGGMGIEGGGTGEGEWGVAASYPLNLDCSHGERF